VYITTDKLVEIKRLILDDKSRFYIKVYNDLIIIPNMEDEILFKIYDSNGNYLTTSKNNNIVKLDENVYLIDNLYYKYENNKLVNYYIFDDKICNDVDDGDGDVDDDTSHLHLIDLNNTKYLIDYMNNIYDIHLNKADIKKISKIKFNSNIIAHKFNHLYEKDLFKIELNNIVDDGKYEIELFPDTNIKIENNIMVFDKFIINNNK